MPGKDAGPSVERGLAKESTLPEGPGRVDCAARSRIRQGSGPFPRSLPPNPADTFRCTGLSGELCRVRDGVSVDVLVTGCADDEGLAPHSCHEGCPRGLARSGFAEVGELGDLVDGH